MPLVIVTMPPHPDLLALLSSVADDVAHALGLGDGDVLVSHVESRSLTASGLPHDPAAPWWPLVVLHGGDRGPDASTAAREAADAAVRAWAQRNAVPLGGVWAQWLTP